MLVAVILVAAESAHEVKGTDEQDESDNAGGERPTRWLHVFEDA
jgi:hypothetical protein